MSIFQRIFGNQSNSKKEEESLEDKGKFMPSENLPLDEKFIIHFKSNGGKFIYCENLEDIINTLQLVFKDNEWNTPNAIFANDNLKTIFKEIRVENSNNKETDIFVTDCEYLISDDGSILFSSNQLKEKKFSEYPENIIVFSKTSQIVENIGNGLTGIKNKGSVNKKIPSNITTIKNFKEKDKDNNFMSYGSNSKNLYLILLEDL